MRVAHIVSQHFVDGRLEDILLKRKQPILGNPSLIHICGVMQFCSASPCDEHFELCRYHSSSMWQAVQVWKVCHRTVGSEHSPAPCDKNASLLQHGLKIGVRLCENHKIRAGSVFRPSGN